MRTAADPEQGFRSFLANSVDAVIIGHDRTSDVERMVLAMKDMKPHIPIMLLSGYDHLPANTLRYIDAFVYHGEPREALLASLDRLLNLKSTFFSRWIGNWRFSIRPHERPNSNRG